MKIEKMLKSISIGKKVLVIGGTGLLGYHTVNHLIENGHFPSVLTLPSDTSKPFPQSVPMHYGNISEMSDSQLQSLMKGYDWLVFSAGGHDTYPLPKDELETLLEEINVVSTKRVMEAGRSAGVTRAVIFGSYFEYFARAWPSLKMAEKHPYIASRIRQSEVAFDLVTDDFGVVVLELPYIWGTMPNREPQWKDLIHTLRGDGKTINYEGGGTIMTSVLHVAEAALGALERGISGHRYPVGDQNVTWTELISKIAEIDGVEREINTLSHDQLMVTAKENQNKLDEAGLVTGINPVSYVQIASANAFFDPEPTRIALGLTSGGLDEAIREQVKMVPIDNN
ncbi:NAD-dependent epimerase/dehydratase family protein [Lutimonas saemankumensis]|uniref:NAD-dependent epimerase/dehydratase family protein n=1 Tax=Lutimonas saemankumensis TaxID=483016 RepID=UPI001CD64FC0|nr:NAD-dependent epimerase/dehydratase family protein [Lutimonas saemankumensis]MCA0932855.1 NAD-dependent epimerase/dehydratase family protein [Lutimonas saemankumensis]